MLEQNEIRFKTRKFAEDYIWFGKGGVDSSWMDNYKKLFFKTDNDIQIFAELSDETYKLYFDKIITSDPNRKDKDHRTLYYVLIAEGKRGSKSSKFLNKLVNFYFSSKEKLSKIFDDTFPIDFIDNNYDNAKTDEVAKMIVEKLDAINANLEEIAFEKVSVLEEDKYLFDKVTPKNKKNFLSELSKIETNEQIQGITSLVYTQNSIEEEYLTDFDISGFSKGLCITTNYNEDKFEPIVRIIREPKIEKEEEVVVVPKTISLSDSNDKSKDVVEDEPPKKVLTASLNKWLSPAWKPLLLGLIVIILTLIVVKSCSNNGIKIAPNVKELLLKDSINI